ncbi:transposase [Jiella pacifica]|uniref:Transposase n=1 Tax=Jiella pacifica TaxID=2696469 RepID=A0A6N9SVW5_9HYPH|nr:transposase [Jiella pacifica]NDW03154.1 hypothetical protein [Jiella pacifica]
MSSGKTRPIGSSAFDPVGLEAIGPREAWRIDRSCSGCVDTGDRLSDQAMACPMGEKKRRFFPEAFKRQAVERPRTSGLSVAEVARLSSPNRHRANPS